MREIFQNGFFWRLLLRPNQATRRCANRRLNCFAQESRIILAIDDKFEGDLDSLIEVGKEKGYLTYGDVNDILPDEIGSADDLDDLITTIGTQGIDLLDSPKFGADKDFELDEGEDVELDLTPGTLEKTNDPVRMYLREMGTVPLLTREGEVEIAKRIERGQLRVLKALSRSPIVINELLAMGEDLKKGVRSIKEVVTFDEEEITDEILQNRLKEFTGKIDDLAKAYKKASQLIEKFATVSQKKRPKDYRRYRLNLARAVVAVSLCVRKLGFTNAERKRLIDRVNKTVDTMRKRLAAKSRRKTIADSRDPSVLNWKNWRAKPGFPFRNSSAPSGKSSR